jgi:DNA-binding MarR family transcriptional regulator
MDDELKALRKLDRVIDQIRSSVASALPLQVAQTFLAVAMKEGQSVSEISEELKSNLSTVSRHLLDLGARNKEQQGINYGLVESRGDPLDMRRKEFYLTPKGKILRKNILGIME